MLDVCRSKLGTSRDVIHDLMAQRRRLLRAWRLGRRWALVGQKLPVAYDGFRVSSRSQSSAVVDPSL